VDPFKIHLDRIEEERRWARQLMLAETNEENVTPPKLYVKKDEDTTDE